MKIAISVCGLALAGILVQAIPAALDGRASPAQSAASAPAGMVLIPGGKFEMGDHHGFTDPKHGSDEIPLHTVRLDSFYMGIYPVTTREYCEFLNSALAGKLVEVKKGGVYLVGGTDLLCDTRESSQASRIGWDGKAFGVLDGKENHPMICVRWHGAVVYCNWLGASKNKPVCYDAKTWDCDFNKSGFRLPTEAEWEYAARGGHYGPYFNYPCGDEADATRANVPESKNPFRSGAMPWTTPVGFFNGKLQKKTDFNWPANQETCQTGNGVNGYGLCDMAGNVWQWCTEWYERNYYSYSPAENPPGPATGSPMPDGKSYRCIRGGSWFNGEYGHSRVSNRDPSYFRGPDPMTGRTDPYGPWFHIGFRVLLPIDAESRPTIKPTPVQKVQRADGPPGGGRPPRDSNHSRGGAGGGQGGAAGQGGERSGGPGGSGGGNAGGENRPPQEGPANSSQTAKDANSLIKHVASFVLGSPEIKADGILPADYTADGNSATLPLEWKGAPEGTKSYAVIMHHIDPKGMAKWYWTLYNIPATVQSLPRNARGVGTLGTNSVNDRTEYAPPKSKGPGAKTYVYTVYALSAELKPAALPDRVNREALLAAMRDVLLATAELKVTYTRPEGASDKAEDRHPGRNSEK